MHKMLIFDLDGTLCSLGKGITFENIKTLKVLEKMGYQIAICSGKPTYYLCGFLRQVELENPIMIGENGANVQFGVDLPPERFYLYPYPNTTKAALRNIKQMIEEQCEGIWFQPNLSGVTPFPRNEAEFEQVAGILDEQKEMLQDVLVYRHVDSFDITPKEINKHNGLKFLTELTGVKAKEMIAVGDGVNDIPMFEYVDYSIGIGKNVDSETDISFESIEEALQYILKQKL